MSPPSPSGLRGSNSFSSARPFYVLRWGQEAMYPRGASPVTGTALISFIVPIAPMHNTSALIGHPTDHQPMCARPVGIPPCGLPGH
ncbi:hypothetical protein FA95DRAFT_1411561 [Auriscalpium vulgare]|uniref:Uncharacterized protein n=1 Tax=Auriscalpium vulgare TaxID=40419 RepID=A0ACB8R1M0_9AGAM|nr:hypothetical protein FA95DRAFT_1411561 [Auriscalpium vulgare]